MTRKFLWVLVIIVFTPCIAFAQRDVRLELEGRFWFTDLEGRVKVTEADKGTDINSKKDLGIKDEGYPEVRLTWYAGKKSKIRIAYTQVGYDGDASMQRTILFNGVVAAYIQVRLTPQDFERPRRRDFAKLNLHLGIFDHPLEK
jgi:hypothetical protein